MRTVRKKCVHLIFYIPLIKICFRHAICRYISGQTEKLKGHITLIIKTIAIICSIVSGAHVYLHGQVSPISDLILQAYSSGKTQALRDISLLDKSTISSAQANLINHGQLIDIQDISYNPFSSENVSYYYLHQKELQYYPHWGAYLRNDLAIPNTPYALIDRKDDFNNYSKKARLAYQYVQNQNYRKAAVIIDDISFIESLNSRRVLLEITKYINKSGDAPKKYQALANSLKRVLSIHGDQHTFSELLKLKNKVEAQNQSESNNTESILNTNYLIETLAETQYTTHKKKQLLFERYGISESFFDHPIDYYGHILSKVTENDWSVSGHIIDIMINTHDPKALFYIASKWYQLSIKYPTKANELAHILRHLLDHDIQVNSPNGVAYNSNNSELSIEGRKRILAYWINNYTNYEWNQELRKFVNKTILREDRQRLIALYKKLNDKSPTIALRAFKQLINHNPILLAEVDKRYSKKLLNYNDQLPSRKYKYLLQLTRLVDYCKFKGIHYKLDTSTESLLTQLQESSDIKTIRFLENKIVDQLTFDNITGLEIWAVIHSSISHIPYSTTRIIEIFYRRNLLKITKDHDLLFSFLKKAHLFRSFGDHGASKYYIDLLLESEDITLADLQDMRTYVNDEDVVSSLIYLIEHYETQDNAKSKINFDDFVKSPSLYKSELNFIQIPSERKYLKNIKKHFAHFDATDKFTFLTWIHQALYYPALSLLIDIRNSNDLLIDFDNKEINSKDFVRIIINKMSAENKEQLTISEQNITILSQLYFDNLQILRESETLSINNLNDILGSDFYRPEDRQLIISSLGKLHPSRNIRFVKLRQKLNTEELKILLPQLSSRNALKYLLAITDVENNDSLVKYLIKIAKDKDYESAGAFFNDLFKKQWLSDYIDSSSTNADNKTEIQWIFTNYLENATTLSEFEEQQTILNIIQIELSGKDIDQKLNLVLNAFIPEDIKIQILKNLFIHIAFDELTIALDYFDEIEAIGGAQLFQFLNNDFGIPIESYSTKAIEELKNDLNNLNAKDLYIKYLNKLGIDIYTNGELNTKMALRLLKEDLVRPFVGTGGTVRDIYVYSVIKILELEFNENLGFHPKLNESQSFYKYTALKRRDAWVTYLNKSISTVPTTVAK